MALKKEFVGYYKNTDEKVFHLYNPHTMQNMYVTFAGNSTTHVRRIVSKNEIKFLKDAVPDIMDNNVDPEGIPTYVAPTGSAPVSNTASTLPDVTYVDKEEPVATREPDNMLDGGEI